MSARDSDSVHSQLGALAGRTRTANVTSPRPPSDPRPPRGAGGRPPLDTPDSCAVGAQQPTVGAGSNDALKVVLQQQQRLRRQRMKEQRLLLRLRRRYPFLRSQILTSAHVDKRGRAATIAAACSADHRAGRVTHERALQLAVADDEGGEERQRIDWRLVPLPPTRAPAWAMLVCLAARLAVLAPELPGAPGSAASSPRSPLRPEQAAEAGGGRTMSQLLEEQRPTAQDVLSSGLFGALAAMPRAAFAAAQIAATAQPIELDAGCLLVSQGGPRDAILFISSGRLLVFHNDPVAVVSPPLSPSPGGRGSVTGASVAGGDPHLSPVAGTRCPLTPTPSRPDGHSVQHAGEGEWIGVEALLAGARSQRISSAVASVVWRVSVDDLLRLRRDDTDVATVLPAIGAHRGSVAGSEVGSWHSPPLSPTPFSPGRLSLRHGGRRPKLVASPASTLAMEDVAIQEQVSEWAQAAREALASSAKHCPVPPPPKKPPPWKRQEQMHWKTVWVQAMARSEQQLTARDQRQNNFFQKSGCDGSPRPNPTEHDFRVLRRVPFRPARERVFGPRGRQPRSPQPPQKSPAHSLYSMYRYCPPERLLVSRRPSSAR
eukprot:TRINITY_DN46886_c0_g1_i1.p1 TRINITY_DN46886_c0_g1~~TRINITY_DN46886_c0_g1_i1.p1  ORF type:complete len:629 (+),score=150.93 TRINITY_DN46886_c0_g1_i1:87-1889(+)